MEEKPVETKPDVKLRKRKLNMEEYPEFLAKRHKDFKEYRYYIGIDSDKQIFWVKLWLFSYPSVLTNVLGARKMFWSRNKKNDLLLSLPI